MYKILTNSSITKLLVFTGVQVSAASSSTCPSQLAPVDQTSLYLHQTHQCASWMCYKRGFLRLYACTYGASVRDISKIVCHHQILFTAVTKLHQFEEKTTNIFAASGFHKIPRIIYCECAHTTIRYWKITRIYAVCSQFNHYVGLVNLPHSSSCSMFPYSARTFIASHNTGEF